jgi:hypothetical protein
MSFPRLYPSGFIIYLAYYVEKGCVYAREATHHLVVTSDISDIPSLL